MSAVKSEGRFTKARPDCPHPYHWTSDDSDSTEHEVSELVAGFVRALQPDFVVETGTAWGQTAEAIGNALVQNGHGQLVTLEIDKERVIHSRLRCPSETVTVIQQSSLAYEPQVPIDFLWIDSLFMLRTDEIQRFKRWASPRCVIGVHDTGPQHPMRQKIDTLVKMNMITQPLYLPTPRGVAFTRYV